MKIATVHATPIFERTVSATADRVFAAYSNLGELKQWGAPCKINLSQQVGLWDYNGVYQELRVSSPLSGLYSTTYLVSDSSDFAEWAIHSGHVKVSHHGERREPADTFHRSLCYEKLCVFRELFCVLLRLMNARKIRWPESY